jgi:NAD(P)-dependent dehydrogenase (short-subunit alcohol dehydrogenase family)
MTRLLNKTAIVTGACGGIGLAAAQRFVAEGAKVMLVDLDEATLARTATELGPNAAYLSLDVSRAESGAALVEATRAKFGKIDIALLNAGIEGRIASIADTRLEDFDRVMAVNARSVWIGLAAIMPAMTETGGGSIIITSSTGGLRGSPGLGAYTASKHAVIGMMRTAALEGASAGIRVNTVNPAPIDTRMMTSIEQGRRPDDPGAARSATAAGIPLGRYGTPNEVAALMLFLASEEAGFCTGGIYQIDGGVIAGARAKT